MRVIINNQTYYVTAIVNEKVRINWYSSEHITFVYCKDREGNPFKFKMSEISKYEK